MTNASEILEGLLLLGQQGGARSTGWVCGAVFWPLLMLVGVIQCAKIAKRPTASALCAWALGLVFLGWGLAVLGMQAAKMIDDPAVSKFVSLGLVVLMLILMVASLVLAIVGLVQYRGYTQGRAQAIWALCLSSLVLVLLVGTVGWAVVKKLDRGPQALANQPAAGQPIAFEDLNFQATPPSRQWVPLPPAAINAEAAIVLRRNKPEVIWIVIAEEFGESAQLDSEALAQIAKSNGLGAAPDAQYSPTTPTTLAGQPAVQMTSRGTIDKQQFTYDYRILTHHGYAYQVITMSALKDEAAMRQEADVLANAFSLIDPSRRSTDEWAGEPVDRLEIPEAGLRLDLGAGWSSWESLAEDFPAATVGALQGFSGELGVVALPMDGLNFSQRELIDALLDELDMTVDGPEIIQREKITLSGVEGLRFEAERESEAGPMTYRLVVMRTPGWAYLIGGWAPPDREDLLAVIDRAIRGVQIDADAKSASRGEAAPQHANPYNALGLAAYHASQYDRALAAFLRARDADSAYETYTNNAVNAYEELKRYRDAVTLAEAHLADYPDHHQVRANAAYQLMYLKETDAAIKHYARSFAGGFRSDYFLQDYLTALRNAGRSEEALWVLEEFAPGDQITTNLLIERCRALGDIGRHDEAIALLAERSDAPLPDPWVEAEWVRALIRNDDARGAAELGARLTQPPDAHAQLWFVRGLAELELDWYPQARASFQHATDLGGDTAYREHLDYVAGLLGRGDNALVRTPVEPVPIPESLNADAPPHPDADDYPARIDLDVFAYHFRPGSPLRYTRRQRITVTGPDALETWSTLNFDFDSQYKRIFLNDLTVTDPDGNVVGRGELDSVFVIDDQQDGIRSDDKTLSIPVPGLAVGCTLDYTVTTETLSDKDIFDFTQHRFLNRHPVARRVVFVDAAEDQVAVEVTAGVEPRSVAGGGRVWMVEAPAIYRWEPLMPDLDTLYPMISLGPVGQTWEGVARDYLGDLADALTPPDDFAATAQAILGDAATPTQVIQRATAHVQQSLTYEALEFGVRGVIPHTLDQITTQRFGDCKDHSLLLYHLLRAGNVNAHLALVQTSQPVVTDLPTLSQFDHMVVLVNNAPAPGTSASDAGSVPSIGDKWLVLDATDKSHPALHGVPVGVQRRPLLILDPERPRLLIDTPASAGNAFQTDRKIVITADGDLEVDEVLTATGPWAEGLLEYLRNAPAADRLAKVQKSLDLEDGLRVTRLTTSDLNDLVGPLRVTLHYTIPGRFDRQPGGWFGRLPAPWEFYYLSPTFLPDRRTPFERTVGFDFRSTVEVELPAGFKLAQLPPGPTAEFDAVNTQLQAASTPTGLSLTSRIALPSGRFPAADYAAYHHALDAGLRALRPTMHLVPSD